MALELALIRVIIACFVLKVLLLYPQIVQIIVVPMECVCQTQAGAMGRMTVEMEVMSMTVVRLDWGSGEDN